MNKSTNNSTSNLNSGVQNNKSNIGFSIKEVKSNLRSKSPGTINIKIKNSVQRIQLKVSQNNAKLLTLSNMQSENNTKRKYEPFSNKKPIEESVINIDKEDSQKAQKSSQFDNEKNTNFNLIANNNNYLITNSKLNNYNNVNNNSNIINSASKALNQPMKEILNINPNMSSNNNDNKGSQRPAQKPANQLNNNIIFLQHRETNHINSTNYQPYQELKILLNAKNHALISNSDKKTTLNKIQDKVSSKKPVSLEFSELSTQKINLNLNNYHQYKGIS
jgi:hypothetical protein